MAKSSTPSASAPSPLAGFPPVLAPDTRILILGSFPGEASLAAQQYYAHPRNQFWRLLSAVLNDSIAALPYTQRLERLGHHRIGLWDVLAACEREGSLDADIRKPRANSFDHLKHACPQLFRVCFNGKTSGRFELVFRQAGFDTLVLPSTSPANAQLSFEQKLAEWRRIVAPAPRTNPPAAQGQLL
ncbi:DNA-deoxyinosine glycosylase [Noviherbaspirillum galbum]|uniref:DNA-deoxyinosine glycosylase n=1 Tax=Noviherbaspirillum galbum TaxID=2709383 RepID=A0A6B3SUA3_9BURK|nr:DNA-deoxyinosine glycosylase [Noviherbaspirillum galbum]NEX61209.1 DNA-deoxyinosine glycosylase [Noviherbaspirillum galbum]